MSIPTPKAVAMLMPSVTPKPVVEQAEPKQFAGLTQSIAQSIGEEQAKALLSTFTK